MNKLILDNLRLKVATVVQFTVSSGKLFQAVYIGKTLSYSTILNHTERGAASLRQLSFLIN